MRWLRALASQMSLTTREDTSEVTAFSNWASLRHTLFATHSQCLLPCPTGWAPQCLGFPVHSSWQFLLAGACAPCSLD